jgi:hypothetical protein
METGWSSVGEHEVYCCGARVLIKDDVVTVLSEPRVRYCPLHESLYGIREIDRASVQRALQEKIKTLDFCCERRVAS